MLPEVHHGEQQKQKKNSYYFNSLIQAGLREYLEAMYELEYGKIPEGMYGQNNMWVAYKFQCKVFFGVFLAFFFPKWSVILLLKQSNNSCA